MSFFIVVVEFIIRCFIFAMQVLLTANIFHLQFTFFFTCDDYSTRITFKLMLKYSVAKREMSLFNESYLMFLGETICDPEGAQVEGTDEIIPDELNQSIFCLPDPADTQDHDSL